MLIIASYCLMGIGLFFLLISAIGALRLPDFYTRSHAIAVTDTLGVILLVIGLILQYGVSYISFKLLLVVIFFCVANPTVTHVLIRAAYKSGLKPWSAGKSS